MLISLESDVIASKLLKQILQDMQLRSQILKWQKKEHLKQGQEIISPHPDPHPQNEKKKELQLIKNLFCT